MWALGYRGLRFFYFYESRTLEWVTARHCRAAGHLPFTPAEACYEFTFAIFSIFGEVFQCLT